MAVNLDPLKTTKIGNKRKGPISGEIVQVWKRGSYLTYWDDAIHAEYAFN